MHPYSSLSTFILIYSYLQLFQPNFIVNSSQENNSNKNNNNNLEPPSIYEFDSSKAIRTLHPKLGNDAGGQVGIGLGNDKLLETDKIKVRRRDSKVCHDLHIRNDLSSFEQLRGCNIIEGSLTIALVKNQTLAYEPKDYENITFPELYEVTDYLLFFRVQGLSTLSRLFPNLSTIRGERLLDNYALIIYEMMQLQKINLPSLNDILSGSVRIENNPNLCYVSTVNWYGISKRTFVPHFIRNNNDRCNNRCPEKCRPWDAKLHIQESSKLEGDIKELGADNKRSLFCWSNQQCHELCQRDNISIPFGPNGGCCSPQCAGGCYEEDRSDQCFSCQHVYQEDKCVEQCDYSLFEYNRRCINEQACLLMVETSAQQNYCNITSEIPITTSNLKAIRLPGEKHGRCQKECPPGSEEDPTNKNQCKLCDKGKCRKVCTPEGSAASPSFVVTNVKFLRERLSGCNVINGSLEISMKGGKNVLHELETAFQDLVEIKGFLKITRSYPLVTLGFLSKLRAINGSDLDRGQYSLIVIDNPNLQELFTFVSSDNNQKQLNINSGKIFVHLNPKLCVHRIDNLKTYANVADWDDRDVSIHTNGDKEACNTQKLYVEISKTTAKQSMVKFDNFARTMDDPRSLLYYLINYRKVPHGTVTMFDGRDGCNSQNDVWTTIEVPPINSNKNISHQEAFIKVEPATRYALYIKTFTIFSGSTGALSDIIYFTTAYTTPGIPRNIVSEAKNSSSIMVTWSPPSKSNGIIERYFITITQVGEMDDYQIVDVCSSVYTRDRLATALDNQNERPVLVKPEKETATKNSIDSIPATAIATCKASSDKDVDLQVDVVAFQDRIIDMVYIKNPCSSNANRTSRRRRSATNNLDDQINLSRKNTSPIILTNSLPVSSTIETQAIKLPRTILNSHPTSQDFTQTHIIFDSSSNRTERNITVNKGIEFDKLTAIVDNLKHFSLYAIEVFACHGETIYQQYDKCSIQAITQVRTKPIPDNDRILLSSLEFHPANVTSSNHVIRWDEPKEPNGLILAFRFRYQLVNGSPDVWTEGCLNMTAYNHFKGFVLTNVLPGSYKFQVRTMSLYSDSPWTEIVFDIPQEYLSTFELIISILSVLFIITIACASGAYYFQKRKLDLTNGLIYASVNPDYAQYDPDEWEVDESNLIIGTQIGTGSFGMVYRGQLKTEKGVLNCAIKTVSPTSTPKQRMDFLREASIMKKFDTFHVVKLMGVISTTTPVYVIMEFMENGDLKKFLRSIRDSYIKEKRPLVDGIYLMAAQIADGMAYLASKKFVHRDLAARNCMVGENRIVKIGDFGLTRDIYVNDYYRRDTQGRLPVRWMAPESLKDNIYDSASDVWSYGIVVWEMVTFSEYPYQGLSNDEVIKRVVSGYTMSRPEACTDKLYSIMEKCWKKDSRDRPTFNNIVEYLLPETENQLYPNCFYRKPKVDDGCLTTVV